MAFEMSIARLTIRGTSPLTQSHQHTEPKKQGESFDDYDLRTFRSKLNVEEREWPDGHTAPTVVIPAFGLLQCIVSGAKYSQRSIQGKGQSKWHKKFEAGLILTDSPALWIDPQTIKSILVSVDANGIRGSGKRVPRRFPFIHVGWEATAEFWVLDAVIVESIFREMAEIAGMFVGVGSYRPQNGGSNGRWIVTNLEWQDNRPFIPPQYKYMNSRQPGTMQ